jgi:murein DD-endopeptidase MepM/ murein hydrolase activator NlpD
VGLLLAGILGCGSPSPTAPGEDCSGFGDWRASPYVLPYPAGASYLVDQGNCSPAGNGHRGPARYGYDFLMPIGSLIVAARAGVVVQVEESHRDGEVAPTGFDNLLVVEHDDGTTALYGHLTNEGALVERGDRVEQSALIARSGNTGNTGNKAHLHFSVAPCDPVARGTSACPTLPVNFRNTEANPEGPRVSRTYRAE